MAGYAFGMSLGLLVTVDWVTPVLPSAEQSHEGLDVSMHGEHAYDADALAAAVRRTVLARLDGDKAGGSEGERVEGMFRRLDADGSGSVSRDELLLALRDMGVDLDAAAAATLLDAADKDGSGELNLAGG